MTEQTISPSLAIKSLCAQLENCIQLSTPGAIIYGLPENRKTYGINTCQRFISEKLNIPVFIYVREKGIKNSESAFFTHLLNAVGYLPSTQKHDVCAKRFHLKNILHEKARKNGNGLVVLFVDNAQYLTIKEYEWLIDVQNDLEQHGSRITTFLVGDQELLDQRKSLRQSKTEHIVARFMIERISLDELNTENIS